MSTFVNYYEGETEACKNKFEKCYLKGFIIIIFKEVLSYGISSVIMAVNFPSVEKFIGFVCTYVWVCVYASEEMHTVSIF